MKNNTSLSFPSQKRLLLYWFILLIFPDARDCKDPKCPCAGVVSNAPLSAAVGRGILADGGSAVDAAIATMFCEGVMVPHCMGLGGGFLMTIYDHKTKTTKVLNARETAPAYATTNMYEHCPKEYSFGGLSTGIPGELKGYWWAHQRYGKLSWEDLVKPAIQFARKGFPVTPFLNVAMCQSEDLLLEDPSLRRVFINPCTDKHYEIGQLIRNPDLANTLEVISQQGESALYDGELTDCFVADMERLGGIITDEDMQNYKPTWCSPLTTTIANDKTLYTVRPPGSGAVLILMLNIINECCLDMKKLNTVCNWHKIIESFKYGYARRTDLGDPNYCCGIDELVTQLITKEYAEQLASIIPLKHTQNKYGFYGANLYKLEDHGTASISVIAPNGDAVVATSTVNLEFGAGVMCEHSGIIPNSEMNDFSIPTEINAYGLPPSEVNFIQPGKRPMSSMAPTIITDRYGNVNLAIGAAGGSKITTSIALVTLRNILFKEPITKAVAGKRLLHQLFPMQINGEACFNKKILNGLKKMGHKIVLKVPRGFEAVNALAKSHGVVSGNFDPRRGGAVAFL